MLDFPFGADAEIPISVEELEYLESKYNSEIEQDCLQADTEFIYSWGLVRSKYKEDNKLGISLLHKLKRQHPDRSRECHYYMALGSYRMGEYGEAKKQCEELLKMEPHNMQARALLEKINSKVTKEGVIGLALVGGVAAAAAGLCIALLRGRNHSA